MGVSIENNFYAAVAEIETKFKNVSASADCGFLVVTFEELLSETHQALNCLNKVTHECVVMNEEIKNLREEVEYHKSHAQDNKDVFSSNEKLIEENTKLLEENMKLSDENIELKNELTVRMEASMAAEQKAAEDQKHYWGSAKWCYDKRVRDLCTNVRYEGSHAVATLLTDGAMSPRVMRDIQDRLEIIATWTEFTKNGAFFYVRVSDVTQIGRVGMFDKIKHILRNHKGLAEMHYNQETAEAILIIKA